MNQKLGQQT